jgi:undecaprenyl pyrophosphate phosphatase UppP
MDKQISTPWAVAAIVVVVIVIALVWRGMRPAQTPMVDTTGGVASRTLGHVGMAQQGAIPPGPR